MRLIASMTFDFRLPSTGLAAQQQGRRFKGVIKPTGQKPAIAIPDFRASGAANAVSWLPSTTTVRSDIEVQAH